MTAIEYIEKEIPIIEYYHKLKSINCLVYHTQYKRMESGTTLWILKKENVQKFEEAMLVQIFVNEMKYGNYSFSQKDENIVIDLNLKILRKRFNTDIQVNKDKELKLLYTEFTKSSDSITMNYDWPNQINIERILIEQCFKEPAIKSFKLLDKWNDIDYVFETQNYFVRFNWGTAA